MEALNRWAGETKKLHPEILKIGLFGSYANNNYAAGSDIDLLIIVTGSGERRWFMRQAEFDTLRLPLPADLFIYTVAEAKRMENASRWFQGVLKDILWIFLAAGEGS